MLKFDLERKEFISLSETQMKNEKILERYDLQEAISNSWNLFRNEIGLPTAYLIGTEINPHPSTMNSIDILAYDPDDSSIVVIELKRDRNKLQLLQALSYAAMVAKWDSSNLINAIQKKHNPEPEELIDIINNSDLAADVKIIMISEYFDPEVILTAEWLNSIYSVDLTAFAITFYNYKDDRYTIFEQRYPLKEIDDVYESRISKRKERKSGPEITWDDVIKKLEYDYAAEAIELCNKIAHGEPGRRRFGSVRTNYDGFKWISINFRSKYINVYTAVEDEYGREKLTSIFGDDLNINSWRDGVSFLVESKDQYDILKNWLRLE